MAECTRQPLLFSKLNRRKIRSDFGGGALTSDGGGLLLREVDRQLGLYVLIEHLRRTALQDTKLQACPC